MLTIHAKGTTPSIIPFRKSQFPMPPQSSTDFPPVRTGSFRGDRGEDFLSLNSFSLKQVLQGTLETVGLVVNQIEVLEYLEEGNRVLREVNLVVIHGHGSPIKPRTRAGSQSVSCFLIASLDNGETGMRMPGSLLKLWVLFEQVSPIAKL